MTPTGLQVARRRDGSLINWRKVLEEVWLAFDNSKEEENDKTKDYDAEPPHENSLVLATSAAIRSGHLAAGEPQFRGIMGVRISA